MCKFPADIKAKKVQVSEQKYDKLDLLKFQTKFCGIYFVFCLSLWQRTNSCFPSPTHTQLNRLSVFRRMLEANICASFFCGKPEHTVHWLPFCLATENASCYLSILGSGVMCLSASMVGPVKCVRTPETFLNRPFFRPSVTESRNGLMESHT